MHELDMHELERLFHWFDKNPKSRHYHGYPQGGVRKLAVP